MDWLPDAGLAIWPLALTMATITVGERVRTARRRESLNRGLHELRRPLQALLLTRSHMNGAAGHVEMALAALSHLDAEVNGAASRGRWRRVPLADVLTSAIERWRGPASIARRELILGSCADGATLMCEPGRLAQAVDNLIANSLEHGRGRIRVDGVIADESILIIVSDGWAPFGEARELPPGDLTKSEAGRGRVPSGRGHGLSVVAAVAADHGGRAEVRRGADGTSVALALPTRRR